MRSAQYMSVSGFGGLPVRSRAGSASCGGLSDQLRVSAPSFIFSPANRWSACETARPSPTICSSRSSGIIGKPILRRGFERFVVSYDLWEEKFSATRMRTARTSASHLTAEAAESWCLDHLSVPAGGLTTDKPVYVRLDVRAQEPKERRPVDEDEGISLARLIDIFSRAGNPASGNAVASRIRARSNLQNVKAVNRLRNRLLLVFLAATLAPLAATLWITTSCSIVRCPLQQRTKWTSCRRRCRRRVGLFSQRPVMRSSLSSHREAPHVYNGPSTTMARGSPPVLQRAENRNDSSSAGEKQDRIDYLVRRGADVHVYSQANRRSRE